VTVTTAPARSQEHATPARKGKRSRITLITAICLPVLAAVGCIIALTAPGKTAGTSPPKSAGVTHSATAAASRPGVAQTEVNPCQDNPAYSAVVGSVCFAVPAEYWQELRDPDYLTASGCIDVCSEDAASVRFVILTGNAYDAAFAGRTIGTPSQELGLSFNPPLNMNSFRSFVSALKAQCAGSRLVGSGTQPFGPKVADYREWTYSCPNSPPQRELQVWDVPSAKIVVISSQNAQSGSTPVQAMVAAASFVTETAAALPSPVLLSPRNGAVYSADMYPRATKLSWRAVSGATGYLVQVQACNYYGGCDASPSGENSDIPPFSVMVDGTNYSFDFVGSQPGRWRVVTLRSDGALSQFSPWWGFSYAGT
jgi:hypothetical protein